MITEDGSLVVNLLLALPHGVAQMAPDFADRVLTSSNLAIIGNTYPGMDMISSGPTTENAPSPAERLHVPSLAKIGEFLGVLLQSLAEK